MGTVAIATSFAVSAAGGESGDDGGFVPADRRAVGTDERASQPAVGAGEAEDDGLVAGVGVAFEAGDAVDVGPQPDRAGSGTGCTAASRPSATEKSTV